VIVNARACASSDLLSGGWGALLRKKVVPVAGAAAGAGGDAGAAKVSVTV
jgi:hypothetical protein